MVDLVNNNKSSLFKSVQLETGKVLDSTFIPPDLMERVSIYLIVPYVKS